MIWVYPNLPMEDVEERIVHRGLTAKRSQSHLQLSSVQDVQDPLLVDDIIAGWWFGCHFLCSYIGLLIIPIDFHIFQRGGPTINQYNWLCYPIYWPVHALENPWHQPAPAGRLGHHTLRRGVTSRLFIPFCCWGQGISGMDLQSEVVKCSEWAPWAQCFAGHVLLNWRKASKTHCWEAAWCQS